MAGRDRAKHMPGGRRAKYADTTLVASGERLSNASGQGRLAALVRLNNYEQTAIQRLLERNQRKVKTELRPIDGRRPRLC